MQPLFDAIINNIPAPTNKNEHCRFLSQILDHSDFLGPIALVVFLVVLLHWDQQVICCKDDNVSAAVRKVTKVFKFLVLIK